MLGSGFCTIGGSQERDLSQKKEPTLGEKNEKKEEGQESGVAAQLWRPNADTAPKKDDKEMTGADT